MPSLLISLSTQESTWNQVTFEKIRVLKKKKKKNNKKKVDKVIWHWGLDFKDALVIFVMWGEILCLWFATWFPYVLNLLESWPIDLVGIENF